jgi:ribosomal protein S18 acetylase RimI-like enzyme
VVPNDAGDLDLPFPHYRCPVCDKKLPLTDARMTVTCSHHGPAEERPAYVLRDAGTADRAAIEKICDRVWGETEIDSFGRTFDVLQADNIVGEVDGKLAGLISLALDRGELAIVMLSVYPEHQGAGLGASLLEAGVARAQERRIPFVKVATTNDDIPALYFYQRHGFVLYEIEPGAVVDHHGEVLDGFAGIPVRDEVRMRRPGCTSK